MSAEIHALFVRLGIPQEAEDAWLTGDYEVCINRCWMVVPRHLAAEASAVLDRRREPGLYVVGTDVFEAFLVPDIGYVEMCQIAEDALRLRPAVPLPDGRGH